MLPSKLMPSRVKRQFLDADAADQRQPRRDLQPVLDRAPRHCRAGCCGNSAAVCRRSRASGLITSTESAGKVSGLPSWPNWISLRLTCNCAAKRFSMPKKTLFQVKIGVVADHLLLVRDEESVAVDHRGAGVEGVGLAVDTSGAWRRIHRPGS